MFVQPLLMHEDCQGSLLQSSIHIQKKGGKKQERSLISSLVTRGVGIATAKAGLAMFFWDLAAMLKHMLDHSECLGGTIHFSGLAGLQGREHFYIRD